MTGSPSGVDPLPGDLDALVCSSRGCRRSATFDVQWNNPKIHSADRRKHWLACDDHRDTLAAYLAARSFLRQVQPLSGSDVAPAD